MRLSAFIGLSHTEPDSLGQSLQRDIDDVTRDSGLGFLLNLITQKENSYPTKRDCRDLCVAKCEAQLTLVC